MRRGVLKIVITQLSLTAAAVLGMAAFRDPLAQPGLAAGFGGAMALVNTLLLAWRTGHARNGKSSPRSQTFGLLLGVVERFVFTLVAFGLGMGFLRLDPLAMLVAFAAAQFGYVAAGAHAQMTGAAGADELKP